MQKEEIIIEDSPTISEIRKGDITDPFETKITPSAIVVQIISGLIFGLIFATIFFSPYFFRRFDFTIVVYLTIAGYILGVGLGVFIAGRKLEKESSFAETMVGSVIGFIIYAALTLVTIEPPNTIYQGVASIFDWHWGLEQLVIIIAPIVFSVIGFYASKFQVYSK